MIPVGQVAYEAFRARLAQAVARGEVPNWIGDDKEATEEVKHGLSLEWSDLEVAEREAWESAAQAVLAL